MKQNQAVIHTLENLGGIATLGQLYQEVFKIEDCKWETKTPFASIRRIVQTTSEIYKVKPGLWALVSHRQKLEARGITTESTTHRTDPSIQVFDHSYYQGLLLMLGNMQGLFTFAPRQDKNRYFLQQKLGEVQNLETLPEYSYSHLVKRSSTIDAIWFNERHMPHSFFEVEASTDFYNSFLKFVDLQDFNARMVIVADERRRAEFDKRINHVSFDAIKERVRFQPYEYVVKQYEHTIQVSQFQPL